VRTKRQVHAFRFILAVVVVAACSGREVEDPFDEAAIRRDMDDHSIKEIYEQYEKSSWTPPSSGRMREQQVAAYVRMSHLARRIVQVCGKDLDEKLGKASHDDGFSRMALTFDAMGDRRNAAIAEIRASQRLGYNARELDWVRVELHRGAYRLAERREQERQIVEVKRIGTDDQVEGAVRNLAAWKRDMREAERANYELLERHELELRPFIALLGSP
jgi:hypothetical protein